MRRKVVLAVIGSAIVLGLLAGCGNQTEEVTKQSEVSAVTQEVSAEPEVPVLKKIGEESADSYHVELTNATGQNIISVAIYDSVSDEYSENLLTEGDPFIAQETRILYCPIVEDETDADEEDAEEKLMTTEYNVEIQLEDESTYVLHAFPFEAMEKGEILIEDDVAYLTYGEYSTKEAEIAIKEVEEQAEAEAAAEAERQKQHSSQTSSYSYSESDDEADEPETTYSDSSSNDSGSGDSGAAESNSESAESNSEPAAVDQDSESCIGDDGLTY